jgi:hypothetical protein
MNDFILKNSHLATMYDGVGNFGMRILSNKCIEILNKDSSVLDLVKMDAFIVFFDYDREKLEYFFSKMRGVDDLEKLALLMLKNFDYTLGYLANKVFYKVNCQVQF